MRDVHSLLQELKQAGIALARHANGKDLSFRAPQGALTPALKTRIAALKEALLAALPDNRGIDDIITSDALGPHPLSAAQTRLWLQEKFDGMPNNLAGAIRLQGPLDEDRLEQALKDIVNRHAMFRTRFVTGPDGHGRQEITPESPFGLERHDLSGQTQAFDQACAAIKGLAQQPFDLASGQLLRARLYQVGVDDHVLMINMPHIVADGVSLQIFDRELALGYANQPIEPPPIRYVDFARWEANQAPDAQALEYWRNQLGDAPVVSMPCELTNKDVPLYTADECVMHLLDKEQAAQWRQFGVAHGATPFMTLLAAFALTLSRVTGEPELTIATAVNHRAKPLLQSVIGFFLNILALRIDLSGAKTFGQLVSKTREVCLDASEHQGLAFERVVEAIKPERIESRNPLARIAFAAGDTPWMPGHTLKLPGIDVSAVDFARGMLDFDMHLWVADSPNGLTGRLEFRSDLYTETVAKQLLARFQTVLQQLLAHMNGPLNRCDALTDQERDWLGRCLDGKPHIEANQSDHPSNQRHSVVDLWRQAVASHGANIALRYAHNVMSYDTLDQYSDRLAAVMLARHIKPGDVVALHLQPGPAMVVAMLATLKSGAAYLPLEADLPGQRLSFMLTDSQARLLISQDDLSAERCQGTPLIKLQPSGQTAELIPAPERWPAVEPQDLAYVMYTSGSTGTPKGVRVPHRAIVRLVKDTNYVKIGASDRIGQLSNSAFDAFTFEIWGALLNGACVVGIDRDTTIDPRQLGKRIADEQITIAFMTTALFNQIARCQPDSLSGLRYLLFGGEQADVPLVRHYLAHAQAAGTAPKHLLHVYGPTENTTFSTYYPITTVDAQTSHLPIGKPVAGTSALVLSADMALALPGVMGELYLGGMGLADGYLDRSELDREKFVVHPFKPGVRLYRTADRVRVNRQGDIEFIGRLDHQIKLRGFRIELGEIEARLFETPGVRAALVTTHGSGHDLKIVAYVASDLTDKDIRQALAASLPPYMLPSVIICLPSLPLNRNGKIDRNQLPPPTAVAEREVVAPRNDVERRLANIWRELIECDTVSVEDDFFDLGGHSLLAARVAARVNEQFAVSAPVRSLFEHPTIDRYARWLMQTRLAQAATPTESIPMVDRSRPLLLSSAQERLWFLDQMNPDSPAYNISYELRITGSLCKTSLASALTALIDRHESLRTRFVNIDDQPRQEICADLIVDLPQTDLRHLPASERDAALQAHRVADSLTPFQTEQAPLMRATLYQLDECDWVLGLCLHHIIADGWSLAVLRRDLVRLYEAAFKHETAQLPNLPIQYADYAVWDRSMRQDLAPHLAYWKEELHDLLPLRLPLDYARPAKPSFKGAAQHFLIDAATTAGLRALCAKHGATLFMALLTAFGVLLQRYSRQDDFVLGSPIAHRNHVDTEDLIGFFVNTLVLRCRLNDDQSFTAHLERTRHTALSAYTHQDLPFERLVQELDSERDPTANPLVQVIFALQNAPVSDQQVHGVNIEPMPYLVATTRFDLEMHLWEPATSPNDTLEGILVYNTALFHPDNIERMSRCFQTLLRSICESADKPIGQLKVVSDQDRIFALAGTWPVTPYPRELTIVDLFSQQVAIHPNKPALLLGEQTMSYEELARASDKLAAQLMARGIVPEAPVVLALERSFAYFVCVLGVIKAGGCYVPGDPNEPASRLSEMLAGVNPWLTIDQALYLQWQHELLNQPQAVHHHPITPDSLAYIMFTSGSTGTPRGVSIPHRAVVRLVKGTSFHPFGSDEVWLQAASLAFDASTLEIWGALLNGASLAILPAGKAAFAEIGAAVRRHQVTSLWLTAGLFHAMVDTDIEALRPVRRLIAGGDVLSVAHIQKAFKALPKLQITNGYGPTENTTFTCCHAIDPVAIQGASIPIGKPVANTSVYIVDQNLEIVADGMPGELVTGGDGLARAYLDAPDLNASRFIEHRFVAEPGARLYRTGDLVRRNAAGDIEFLGRIDDQTKIRGFRVETGEIEHLLRAQADVEDVAVVAHGDSDAKQLFAYVVPAVPEPADIRTTLGQEQVGDWESLFDGSLYQNLQDGVDPSFNIAGWKSSYTNQEIPTEQMRDWLEDFVGTVKRYPLDKVLEIGCGTGMVLFRLAPLCTSYVGTDFSGQALAHIERHLPARTPVKLYQRKAIDTSGFEPGEFDTIILNSVVQYFPDIDYLNQVIAKCLPLIKDGGRLIVGDIRHFPLLRAFHAGVQFAQHDSQTRVRQWRSVVDRSLLEEDELVIAPSFFSHLEHDRISRVAFRMQRPAHDNELSKFRYTAIMEVGPRASGETVPEPDVTTAAELERHIDAHHPAALIVRGIPNSRVKFDVALAGALDSRAEQNTSLGALAQRIRQQDQAGVDPSIWWPLAHKMGYHADVGWTDDNAQGAYDVLLTAHTNATHTVGVPAQTTGANPSGRAANQPLRGKLARALGPKLRECCRAHLPDHMVPSQFVMLPSMPLTPSGKLDKRAFYAPARALQAERGQIALAENHLERAITKVWADLLGIEQPSVTDNFFDLGGHSLLMVQACNRIKTSLGIDVTVLAMFEHPTIRSLALALGQSSSGCTTASPSNSHINAATQRAQKQRQRIEQQAQLKGRQS